MNVTCCGVISVEQSLSAQVASSDACKLCLLLWGQTSQRIKVPIVNEKQKQTYYGAIDLQTKKMLIQAFEKGESTCTIAFLEYLQSQYPQSRIALIWDGASYHRSQQRERKKVGEIA